MTSSLLDQLSVASPRVTLDSVSSWSTSFHDVTTASITVTPATNSIQEKMPQLEEVT